LYHYSADAQEWNLKLKETLNSLESIFIDLPFEIIYVNNNDSYATVIYNCNFDHKYKNKDVRAIVLSEIHVVDALNLRCSVS